VSNFKLGLLSSIPFLTTAVAMVLVATHSDRANERRWHLAGAACTGALAAWLAAHVNSTPPTVLFLSLAVAGTLSMMGPFWALSTRSLSGSTAPAGIALINSVGNLGGFIGPYIMGSLSATAGLRGGVVVIGVALLLSGAVALLVREHRQTSAS
jgi:ACS family tartrate transporter-like MFS transporter